MYLWSIFFFSVWHLITLRILSQCPWCQGLSCNLLSGTFRTNVNLAMALLSNAVYYKLNHYSYQKVTLKFSNSGKQCSRKEVFMCIRDKTMTN